MFIKKQLNVRVKQPTVERSSPLSSTSAWPIAAHTPILLPFFFSHIRAQIKWFCFSIGSATERERLQRPTGREIQCTRNCNQNAPNTINAKVCLDFVICECWVDDLGMGERAAESGRNGPKVIFLLPLLERTLCIYNFSLVQSFSVRLWRARYVRWPWVLCAFVIACETSKTMRKKDSSTK